MTEVYQKQNIPTTAGSEPTTFANGQVASGVTCPKLTPLALRTADSQIVVWDPAGSGGAEKALFLSAMAIDTTAGAAQKEVIKGGYFNEAAINWPDGMTAVQKAAAFAGTPISHSVVR
ncbi:head decoration protein [Marinomonas ostreistagni]|uniref:Head decoration protein n=1 Tax=Marinomonas ostreistagni TaxID=359209 RepID=A0ABS0ZAQ6_9GAMM|nr:head decoration protein [Marinomonas ostreistagni]MBJ7550749.1 head decoration protein [Marinomonas ostreistagni]